MYTALALDIAKTYPRLIGEEDGDGMTALQLLACKPSVFNNGFEANFFKRFICKSMTYTLLGHQVCSLLVNHIIINTF